MRSSSLIFKENHYFIEKDNHSDKVVMVAEELNGIGNFMDLPRLIFIDEECGNLNIVVDGGEFTRNKKSPEVI